jgi:hypothetical protein
MFNTVERGGMNDIVLVQIPVSPDAADALGDAQVRERIGKLVSSVLKPKSAAEDPLAVIFGSIKATVQADGVTDEEIDAELAAYNAERRI